MNHEAKNTVDKAKTASMLAIGSYHLGSDPGSTTAYEGGTIGVELPVPI